MHTKDSARFKHVLLTARGSYGVTHEICTRFSRDIKSQNGYSIQKTYAIRKTIVIPVIITHIVCYTVYQLIGLYM